MSDSFFGQIEDEAAKVENLTRDSARRQFFKALYDRDYDLVKLLLTGSRRKYVHANLICLEDRWTACHACLYKFNQYPPQDTLRIVKLLLDHNADVNKPCPEGAVAINVLDKKPLPNGQQNGPDNPNREKKTVSFQNKMVLDVAIDFLQAYKWAGCRQTVLSNWKPLIELLDNASMKQSHEQAQDNRYQFQQPKSITVDEYYTNTFRTMYREKLGTDCTITVIPPKNMKHRKNQSNSHDSNHMNSNGNSNQNNSNSNGNNLDNQNNTNMNDSNNGNNTQSNENDTNRNKTDNDNPNNLNNNDNTNDNTDKHGISTSSPHSASYQTDVKDDGSNELYNNNNTNNNANNTGNKNNSGSLDSLEDDIGSGSLDTDSESEHHGPNLIIDNNGNNNSRDNSSSNIQDSFKIREHGNNPPNLNLNGNDITINTSNSNDNNSNNNNSNQNQNQNGNNNNSNNQNRRKYEIIDDTKEREFHCHKSVLMGASPVMRAMFSSSMEENRTSKIRMDDMLPSSVECMLHYIYCGEILEYYFNKEENNNNIQIALNVLCLSDKYDIKGLKEHCEYRLHVIDELLCPENALEILIAADRYSAYKLRKVAMSYVTMKFDQISQSSSFGEFSHCNPKLVQELFTAVAAELQRKSRQVRNNGNNGNGNGNGSMNNGYNGGIGMNGGGYNNNGLNKSMVVSNIGNGNGNGNNSNSNNNFNNNGNGNNNNNNGYYGNMNGNNMNGNNNNGNNNDSTVSPKNNNNNNNNFDNNGNNNGNRNDRPHRYGNLDSDF